ncbi:MAG TPA: hypothetical protein VHC22_30685 [Pirellulales bacterium]|nr:hypothetical protein [Pirellulales bacterium]
MMRSSCRRSRLPGGALGIVLVLFGAGEGRAAEPSDSELADGELVDRVGNRNQIFEGFLRAEVTNTVNRARATLATDPQAAEKTLELLSEKVGRAGEIRPDVRAQLVDQIESALRLARRQVEIHNQRGLLASQHPAQREAAERYGRQRSEQERSAADSMSQFQSLMAEGRYRDAEMLAAAAEEAQPNQPAWRNAVLLARTKGSTTDLQAVRIMKERGVVDVWRQEEIASIPTPDSPPILYPDPEVWQSLTERRNNHAVDVKKRGASELKILDELDERTEVDFIDEPLTKVVDYLKDRHGIEIQIDRRALFKAGISPESLITYSVKGVTLRSALKLLLRDLDLTYTIRYEVLLITTQEEAEMMREARVYPVADLVSPSPFVRRAARRYGIQNMSRAAAAGSGAF